MLLTAGHDPLRDEGIAFGDALDAAGVPTTRRHYEGGIHGFVTMPRLTRDADRCLDLMASEIALALARRDTTTA